ncbi:MAG: glycosyltransferase [Coleofasciculus sp. D1-CHI-01]|uniref:glycosyltransferase n=1 Tax=Coleofasciculus sp. D1-CHI-01 TaxID=3068482 RepID=UPI0032F3B204
MKIAYITANFGLISETFVTDLAENLSKSGQLIRIFTNSNSYSINTNLEIDEVRFLTISSIVDKLGFRIDNFLGKRGEFWTYQRRLKQAHKSLLPVLKKYQPDVAYIDFGTVAALAYSVLEQLNIPFIVHFHGADITSALNDVTYREELKKIFKTTSALIVASNHIRRLLVLEGALSENIYVVRYGINLEGLVPKTWNERKSLPPSVVFIGRFTPKKHPVALVEAFVLVKKQVPDAQLSLIGDGSEMPRVKQRIEKLGLDDSVKLYGALPRAEALPIVNQHWVFAQHSVTAPSGDQEGFGISLAEAAALELPIISTLHNGIPEQVIDRKTGFLVREFDYEAMAECIIKLLNNPGLAEQMGKYGRQHISQLCQTNQRVDSINKILISAYKISINDI